MAFRACAGVSLALFSGLFVGCTADSASTDVSPGTGSDHGSGSGSGSGSGTQQHVGFRVIDLVSDQPSIARHTDANLVNAWGMVELDDNYWIADNGTGKVSIFDKEGNAVTGSDQLDLGEGITGIAINPDASSFMIHANTCPNGSSAAAKLVVASENGTLIAVNPDVSMTRGFVVVDRSSVGAIYKSVAIVKDANGMMLLAADFHNARIDVFDASFNLVRTDKFRLSADMTSANPGFAPFDIALLGDAIYVTYAKQDADKEDDVAGAGLGIVAKFDLDGNLLGSLQSQNFNAPWALTLATSNFCDASGLLLVGNFGDGRIIALDPDLKNRSIELALVDAKGAPIVIDGLWALVAEEEGVFFTAGPADETHGLYGKLEMVGAGD